MAQIQNTKTLAASAPRQPGLEIGGAGSGRRRRSRQRRASKLREIDRRLGCRFEPRGLDPLRRIPHLLAIAGLRRPQSNSQKKSCTTTQASIFLRLGFQCVIAGSATPAGRYAWADPRCPGFTQSDVPDALLQLLSEPAPALPPALGDFMPCAPAADIQAWLEVLDPSMPNNEWVKVGMALHDWSPAEGLELWEAWSRGGKNYDEGETATRWKSFSQTPGGISHITLAYLSGMAMSRKIEGGANAGSTRRAEAKSRGPATGGRRLRGGRQVLSANRKTADRRQAPSRRGQRGIERNRNPDAPRLVRKIRLRDAI